MDFASHESLDSSGSDLCLNKEVNITEHRIANLAVQKLEAQVGQESISEGGR